ncbi:acetyltransferase [Bacillus subtilis]|nr:acetyltransferase [Bacillus subtilis]OBA01475.1 acetyltransferase [Bacillus subtilis]
MSEDIFRLATVEDAPELLKLVNSAFQPVRQLDIDWPSTRADIHMVSENIENHSAIVLERDGKLISTITIRFPWESEKPPSKYPFVWWFATLPEYKGRGAGSKLLTHVEENVLRDMLKAPALTLGTSARKHPWLADMYRRRGYEVYFEQEKDGDIGVMMHKVLIPERFDPALLGVPSWA